MSTFGEVFAVGYMIKKGLAQGSGDPGFSQEFERRFTEINTTIAREQELPLEETISLYSGTILGDESQRLFNNLQAWLREQETG